MKYCSHCGAVVDDNAVICTHCGCVVDEAAYNGGSSANAKPNKSLDTAIKVFMVLGTIMMAFSVIGLIWSIPMTVSFFRSSAANTKVGTGFKVCTLLFVSLIAGVLLLIRDESGYYEK